MTTQTPATTPHHDGLFQRFASLMGWTRTSYTLIGVFFVVCGLIVYIWWPLAEEYLRYLEYVDWQGAWWKYMDWLLLGIWIVMSLLLMRHADLRHDLPIVLVCIGGGLVIEGWGTQTELWRYYTLERPPLWIIPAWPVAGLSIDRLVRLLDEKVPLWDKRWFAAAYWVIMPVFYILMLQFVRPTFDKSLTVMVLILSTLLIATPKDYRLAVITFVAGVGLGYFLELWGTTRLCWTYYTKETPPLFAVLAHGMAALAFWRVTDLLLMFVQSGRQWIFSRQPAE